MRWGAITSAESSCLTAWPFHYTPAISSSASLCVTALPSTSRSFHTSASCSSCCYFRFLFVGFPFTLDHSRASPSASTSRASPSTSCLSAPCAHPLLDYRGDDDRAPVHAARPHRLCHSPSWCPAVGLSSAPAARYDCSCVRLFRPGLGLPADIVEDCILPRLADGAPPRAGGLKRTWAIYIGRFKLCVTKVLNLAFTGLVLRTFMTAHLLQFRL